MEVTTDNQQNQNEEQLQKHKDSVSAIIIKTINDYHINTSDNTLPKALGILDAFQEIMPDLIKNISSCHMARKLANELRYTATLCKHLSLETIKRTN